MTETTVTGECPFCSTTDSEKQEFDETLQRTVNNKGELVEFHYSLLCTCCYTVFSVINDEEDKEGVECLKANLKIHYEPC